MASPFHKVLRLMALIPAGWAAAAGAQYPTSRAAEPWIDMGGMRVGTYEVELDYNDGTDNQLDIGFIEVELMDYMATPHLLAGLVLGYVAPTQSGRTATAGMNPTGASLGLRVDWRYPLLGDTLSVSASGTYTYNDASGRTDQQETNLTWHSFVARAGLGLRAGSVALLGGAVYRNLDGTESTFGDVDETTKFSIKEHSSVYLELEFRTDPQGYIGLVFEEGAASGGHFYFQHFFK